MTGKINKPEEYIKRVKIINSMFNKEYCLGASSAKDDDKVDCFSAISLFVKKAYGVDLGAEFDGKTYDQYCEIYKEDKNVAMLAFKGFIELNFTKINILSKFIGDVVVSYTTSEDEVPSSVGIDCGNNNVMVVTEYNGTTIINNSFYPKNEAYRWL